MIYLAELRCAAKVALMVGLAALCFVRLAHGGDGFGKDVSSGCAVFKPNLKASEAVTWKGACVGGYGQGRGVAKWIAGDGASVSFEGSFVQGRLQGPGMMSASGGDRYEGDYKDGLRDGHGMYVSANGDRYVGEYSMNQRNGHGTLTLASGRRLVGEWRNGSQVATTESLPPQPSGSAQLAQPPMQPSEAPAGPRPTDRAAVEQLTVRSFQQHAAQLQLAQQQLQQQAAEQREQERIARQAVQQQKAQERLVLLEDQRKRQLEQQAALQQQAAERQQQQVLAQQVAQQQQAQQRLALQEQQRKRDVADEAAYARKQQLTLAVILMVAAFPIVLGSLVSKLKWNFAVATTDRMGVWIESIETKAKMRSKSGLLSRFFLRPVIWCFHKLFATTSSVVNPFLRAGVRIGASLYLIYGAIMTIFAAAFAVFWVIAVIGAIFLTYWVFRLLPFLLGDVPSVRRAPPASAFWKNDGEARSWQGFLGKYTQHTDASGKVVGESREREGLLGKYTQYTDPSGEVVAESREREGLLGKYTQYTDPSSEVVMESREREGLLGKYTESTDPSGEVVSESYKRRGVLGEYTETKKIG